jgi:uncharacterized protein (TIGR02231 family)
MRNLAVIAVVLLCMPVLAQEQKTLTVESRIESVTVYREGATVARRGKLRLDAGQCTVLFENLPGRLDVSSVRGRIEGTKTVQIAGVETNRVTHEAPAAAALKKLDVQIADLANQKAQLDAERAAHQAEIDFAKTVAASGFGEKANRDTKTLTETAQFVRETIMRAEREKLKLARQMRDLDAKMVVLQEQARSLRIAGSRTTHTVSMTLTAARAANVEIVLTYRVLDAAWVAAHDVRLNERTGEVELTAYAVVNQQSGEEWRNVMLTFSTTHPTASVALPEFQPLVIRPESGRTRSGQVILLDEEQSATVRVPRGTSLDNLSNKNLAARGYLNAKDQQLARFMNETQQALGGTSAASATALRFSNVTFHRTKPETIPMDDRPHRCILFTAKFKGQVERMTIPALAQAVFLRAKLTNTSDHPILPGLVNVFIEANFIGTAFMDPVAPGEDFIVYFGADKDLKVTRKLMESRSESPTKFRSSHKVMRHWITTVQNFHKKELEILVVDQVPVSWSDNVRVAVISCSPAGPKPDEFGRIEWKMNLTSLKKAEFDLAYEAEFPSGTVVNLERKTMESAREYYRQKKK